MKLVLSIALLVCATCAKAQTTFEHHGFKALLNGKIQVEVAFDEIQEPDIDRKTKTITSRARDYQTMYIDTWKWKNGKLKKISTKKLPLH